MGKKAKPEEQRQRDALAVETTSLALLTIFQVEGGGVTSLQVGSAAAAPY